LAGKRGFGVLKKAFYFALLHVLVVFCFCKSFSVNLFRHNSVSQKNRAEKPTIGFLFLGSGGKIAF